ncbi:MAG: hypothetical protein FWE37_06815, partial [Spirochaetaceae bacterium]|nr:hypothetical protein [Spirochaetaceae bacterium]
SEETLEEIQQAAIKLLKAAGYHYAGTVEFLYDTERNEFYFMEVNARLQVEHPITEQLYAIDLVRGQLDVAMGKSIESYPNQPRGHVIEVRLNAEDPEQGFRPSPGKVSRWRPAGGINVRIDSGITEGSVIPGDFDSMVAKIIVTAPTRAEALARLERAIAETQVKIDGGTTNRTFLLELLNIPQIKAGGVTTRFVEEYLTGKKPPQAKVAHALCAVAAEIYRERENDDERLFHNEMMLAGRVRAMAGTMQELQLQYLGRSYRLMVRRLSRYLFAINYSDKVYYFNYRYNIDGRLTLAGQQPKLLVTRQGDNFRVEVDNVAYIIESDSGGAIKASGAGLVLAVKVKSGDKVTKGTILASLEAMKMELPLVAAEEAIVGEILVKAGDGVTAGQVLMRLDKVGSSAGNNSDSIDGFAQLPADNLQPKTELCALFLGYDSLPVAQLKELIKADDKALFIKLISYFNAVERLFSEEKLARFGEASVLSFAEWLAVYYKSYERNEESFPAPFINAVNNVLKANNITGNERRVIDRVVFRLYKTHFARQKKEQVLNLALPHLNINKGKDISGLDEELDDLAGLALNLKQLALNMRYQLFDREALSDIARRRLERLERILPLLANETDTTKRNTLMQRAVSYGEQSERLLVNKVASGQNDIALEVLSHRLYRGVITNYKFINEGAALVTYKKHNGEERTTFILVPRDLKGFTLPQANAVTTLVFVSYQYTMEQINNLNIASKRLIIGYDNGELITYQNYIKTSNGWQADENSAFLSPLNYRELRLYRLANFDKKFEQINNNVTFVTAVAKENKNDERFFVFMNLESTEVQLDEEGKIKSLVGFEDAVNEGLMALRTKQALRKKPLYWNRLTIAIWPQLSAEAGQIEEYVARLFKRYITNDMGLERISIVMRKNQDSCQELLINQFSSSNVNMVWREAASDLLKARSSYENAVVKARSRNLFYPYELINGLCDGSTGLGQSCFEEYDLSEDGAVSYRSVKGRPYGQNKAGIVFGLISTQEDEVSYKRVLLMSEATGDMGSLAEAECRRVNAALDLAADLKLPVEWLPISSGARIDMDSGTENLDWTANTLKRIIQFTEAGGEINIIVSGINVGAQSYWNSEATMLMHCRGLLIMTTQGTMLLTGKRALDFAGAVSGKDNLAIGGAKEIMTPNGEAQIEVESLEEAYKVLMQHYRSFYAKAGERPAKRITSDLISRDVGLSSYSDTLGQGFTTIGDIFGAKNSERKKPFAMREVMTAVIDNDFAPLERFRFMQDGETAIVWQTRVGGEACGLIGIESHALVRRSVVPYNGPESYTGGTLFPQSSKKVARAINSFSGRVPLVVLANLSGFDGSPESLRKNQLEWGAEIGRAVVNFNGPILFIVVGRYHGGAYVVFSKQLNPNLRSIALEGAYASVIGGAPAAAVVFTGQVLKATYSDERLVAAQKQLEAGTLDIAGYDNLYKTIHAEKQTEWAKKFDEIHSAQRAKEVGSIDEIIKLKDIRAKIVEYIKS